MKKINNKGMTLTELIVSFVIVSVAVIYFSTTLIRIIDIYKKSEENTNKTIEVNYNFRLLDAYIDSFENEPITEEKLVSFAEKHDIKIVSDEIYKNTDTNILSISIEIDGSKYIFNKYYEKSIN